jgi:hypothetical protein
VFHHPIDVSTGTSACEACPVGQQANRAANTCESCPFGYVATEANECVECPAYHRIVGDDCLPCPFGFGSNVTRNDCIPCFPDRDVNLSDTSCPLTVNSVLGDVDGPNDNCPGEFWTNVFADTTDDVVIEADADIIEWTAARIQCGQLLTERPTRQNKKMVGPRRTIEDCARGFVSQRCGGTPRSAVARDPSRRDGLDGWKYD